MVDVSQLTIAAAGKAFRSRELSPVELTETYLRRVEQLDGRLNSFITITGEAALRAARVASDELAAGIDRGPLHGIPIAYKDLIATAGVRTSSASRILADRVPDEDATVVQQLSAAGAVPLGKLNMLEFAYGVVHPDYGAAVNPWNPAHASGGSSSGSGVAVAAGLTLGALGTDTGGSIRNPASWCGVVGHKPTYGLVSRSGVDPLSWSLDHGGPMTRTAEDAALLLEAMAGYDPKDPGSAPAARFRAADLDEVNLSTLRIGVPRQLLDDGVDESVRGIVEEAIRALADRVHRVETVVIDDLDDLVSAAYVIMFAEASAFHLPWIQTRPNDYAPLTRDRLEAGLAISAAHYINAQRTRRLLINAMARLHQQVDLLALPASPVSPMHSDATSLEINGTPVDVFRSLVRITGIFNVTGSPAVSIPCGWTEDGLPVGLQLTGRPFEDHVVLAAARAFEESTAFEPRLPAFDVSKSENT